LADYKSYLDEDLSLNSGKHCRTFYLVDEIEMEREKSTKTYAYYRKRGILHLVVINCKHQNYIKILSNIHLITYSFITTNIETRIIKCLRSSYLYIITIDVNCISVVIQ
jgi:hypothetical protein